MEGREAIYLMELLMCAMLKAALNLIFVNVYTWTISLLMIINGCQGRRERERERERERNREEIEEGTFGNWQFYIEIPQNQNCIPHKPGWLKKFEAVKIRLEGCQSVLSRHNQKLCL